MLRRKIEEKKQFNDKIENEYNLTSYWSHKRQEELKEHDGALFSSDKWGELSPWTKECNLERKGTQ